MFGAFRALHLSSTNCEGFSTGSARSITASIKLKMAVFAPMPNAKGEDGHRRKAGRFREHAQAIADDLQQLLQPNDTPHLSRLFLYSRHVAELARGRITRFLRRHPTLDVVLRLPFDVVMNILLEIFQHALTAPHYSPSRCTGRRIRAIAPANLSHLPVSTASCRRPLAVNRYNLPRRLFSEVPYSAAIHPRLIS